MARLIRTLLFSTLYPNSIRPRHGIFVETRLSHLLASGQVETRVVAPVPWFPFQNKMFGDYAKHATVPRYEERNGIRIEHPRYLLLPRIGMNLAPLAMALGAYPTVRRLIREGFDFDLIDAHYYYPDGVAAALIGKWLDKPYVVTARGTDLNMIPKYRLPRCMIKWAAKNAQASIGVCSALVDVLRGWDMAPERLHVMRNGVDLERFRPFAQAEMRRELGIGGSPLLISVGYLIERKGHDIVIDALAQLLPTYPHANLLIIGEGPERQNLERQVRERGLGAQVRFTGALPNAELAHWYSAADVLILASSREGWANVLLEAMACGTPVVATRIWGSPEVIASDVAGRLVERRDAADIAAAVGALMQTCPDRAAVRRYAEGFSWSATSEAQLALFRQIAGANLSEPSCATYSS